MRKSSTIGAARLIIMMFFISMVVGTLLLFLPIASSDGHSIYFIDALFTATSAITSTGLSVVNIAETYSVFGQVVIMILVQMGGLGFMVLGVLIALLLGKKIGMRQRTFLQVTTQSVTGRGLVKLSMYILAIALVFEFIATIILSIRFSSEMSTTDAIYNGIFHAVTAFNNAGFTLSTDNLMPFSNDPFVTTTIMILIIFGGLGFIVIVDMLFKRKWRNYTLHSKMILIASAALIIIGAVFIFIIELSNTKNGVSQGLLSDMYNALFQSVTARSAGYNTIDLSAMLSSSQFIIIILMFIGGASSSTGGGIKVNTFVIITLATLTTFRGGGPIQFFKRTIPQEAVMRAIAVVVSSIGALILLTLILSITEDMLNEHFLEVFFEAASALSTAGLSIGLTPELSDTGKVIISLAMFIGRLGPLTLGYALAMKVSTNKINYPEEKVMIG